MGTRQSDRWSCLEYDAAVPRAEPREPWGRTLAAVTFVVCIAVVVAVALMAAVAWHVSQLFGD